MTAVLKQLQKNQIMHKVCENACYIDYLELYLFTFVLFKFPFFFFILKSAFQNKKHNMLLLNDLIMYVVTIKSHMFFVLVMQLICLNLKNRSAHMNAHKKMNLNQVMMMPKFKMPLKNSLLRIV